MIGMEFGVEAGMGWGLACGMVWGWNGDGDGYEDRQTWGWSGDGVVNERLASCSANARSTLRTQNSNKDCAATTSAPTQYVLVLAAETHSRRLLNSLQ